MKTDIAIVGAGHNGLVAAALLAEAGFDVRVFEQKDVVGGAVKTETPFEKVPALEHSTGAYLLGLTPPELLRRLDVELPIIRRDPHYFLPRREEGYLLFGSDEASTRRQFVDFFSQADWEADRRLQRELDMLRDDIGPTWLDEPMSIEETAERHVRPELRETFVDLCRNPVGQYLARFGFESDLVQAMYAVTDGFTGSASSWDDGASGMNFLIHNMCRMPQARGVWSLVRGGMGTVSRALAHASRERGAHIETGAAVTTIESHAGSATGVVLDDGRRIDSNAVLVNADPFRMRDLVGRDALPDDYLAQLDEWYRDGTTLKVNLALSDLPTFDCLPTDEGQFGTTIHILPREDVVMDELDRAWDAVGRGALPDFPSIEWYIHTPSDPTLSDPAGHHSSALFVQWVPYELAGGDWEDKAEAYARTLLSICDEFAPGTSDLVADMSVLHPKKIEEHFGITAGHIHHIDNVFGFDERHPYSAPLDGLYSCSAGCHPGGSVIGAAGHNAAVAIGRDLGRPVRPANSD
jgi:phytoene dehydrogenase-like protein